MGYYIGGYFGTHSRDVTLHWKKKTGQLHFSRTPGVRNPAGSWWRKMCQLVPTCPTAWENPIHICIIQVTGTSLSVLCLFHLCSIVSHRTIHLCWEIKTPNGRPWRPGKPVCVVSHPQNFEIGEGSNPCDCKPNQFYGLVSWVTSNQSNQEKINSCCVLKKDTSGKEAATWKGRSPLVPSDNPPHLAKAVGHGLETEDGQTHNILHGWLWA